MASSSSSSTTATNPSAKRSAQTDRDPSESVYITPKRPKKNIEDQEASSLKERIQELERENERHRKAIEQLSNIASRDHEEHVLQCQVDSAVMTLLADRYIRLEQELLWEQEYRNRLVARIRTIHQRYFHRTCAMGACDNDAKYLLHRSPEGIGHYMCTEHYGQFCQSTEDETLKCPVCRHTIPNGRAMMENPGATIENFLVKPETFVVKPASSLSLQQRAHRTSGVLTLYGQHMARHFLDRLPAAQREARNSNPNAFPLYQMHPISPFDLATLLNAYARQEAVPVGLRQPIIHEVDDDDDDDVSEGFRPNNGVGGLPLLPEPMAPLEDVL